MAVAVLGCCANSGAMASYLSDVNDAGFILVAEDHAAPILVEASASPGVLRAAHDFQDDVFRVTQQRPAIIDHPAHNESLVLVAEIGKSPLLDNLIANGKVDVSALRGRWDGYLIQHVLDPFEHTHSAWVIVGANKRGAMYGLYDVSETIGVSPWYWWADVPAKQHKTLTLTAGTRIIDWPRVKYRGIFLNDEAPALSAWVGEKFGNYNAEFYQHVFELLLRLKANYLWPAMWNNAFADDDPRNALLADEMGIVMGTSHHEPMMRADKEWNRYGSGKWEYSTNAENLKAFWQQGARRHKDLESVFTLGMRGQEDTPMSEGQNVALLEEIVGVQRNILADTYNQPLSAIPQVWALYKEVQGFYERGMRVPDDVTLLWSDDNFGNIRRLPLPQERDRSGGAGVYYHFDYVGEPRSYRWINTVPLGKIYEQMSMAWEYGARQIWIANVGDLKPMELPTDFFLSMAWDPQRFDGNSASTFTLSWASQQFTQQSAATVAELLNTYTLHNGRRKPEALTPDTYSLYHYEESKRVSAWLQDAANKAVALQRSLPEEYRSAFYELVGYPVRATQNLFALNRAQAINKRNAQQDRVTTSASAATVEALFERDKMLADRFHLLEHGRWQHMMSQPHIGYVHWRNPPANLPPVTYDKKLALPAVADMGVTTQSQSIYWPNSEWNKQSLSLTPFTSSGTQTRRFTIYNRQARAFNFVATPAANWIQLSSSAGSVTDETVIDVSIDWLALPLGEHTSHIHVKGTGWGGADIAVKAVKVDAASHGFVETDGVISLNASSGNVTNNSDDIQWEKLSVHGRTGTAVRSFVAANGQVPERLSARPVLSFPLYFYSTGTFDVTIDMSPTLPFFPDSELTFLMALDEAQPSAIKGVADKGNWAQEVLDNVRKINTSITVNKPGPHTLHFYAQDTGVVLQKIVIDTGGLEDSYLGPPESPFVDSHPIP